MAAIHQPNGSLYTLLLCRYAKHFGRRSHYHDTILRLAITRVCVLSESK